MMNKNFKQLQAVAMDAYAQAIEQDRLSMQPMSCIHPVGTKGTNDSFERTGHALREMVKPSPSISLNANTIHVYARAVEEDRKFTQRMMQTMTPEQINRFCFENGFSVPEPKDKVQ